MNITIWDLFKYVFKWKIVIIAVVIIAILGTYLGVNRIQTYNSTVVLQLTDSCISDGEAPDGSKFDINEIVSPNVLTNVIEELELDITVDSLRSGVSIESVIPASETEIRTSKEELGEKYEYFPNTFLVTYTGDVGESTGDVRDILESITDNYIEFYNSKYLKLASVNDIAYDEDMGNFDYIDMADMISANLDDISSALGNYHERDASFRSSSTGYTFSDLIKEYEYLSQFTVPSIYADIFAGQITKNRDKLIKAYTQKKEEHLLDKNSFMELSYIAKSRMDSFSAANMYVPNAYNAVTGQNDDELEIIDEVHDEIVRGNTTTTYDDLINSYVDHLIEANNSQLNADKCDEIIAKFTLPMDESVNRKNLEKEIEETLKNTRIKMTELNKTVNKVIEDYNNYSATSHVKPLTGVNYYATISFLLYGLLAAVAGGLFALIAVVAYEIIQAMKRENAANE